MGFTGKESAEKGSAFLCGNRIKRLVPVANGLPGASHRQNFHIGEPRLTETLPDIIFFELQFFFISKPAVNAPAAGKRSPAGIRLPKRGGGQDFGHTRHKIGPRDLDKNSPDPVSRQRTGGKNHAPVRCVPHSVTEIAEIFHRENQLRAF